MSAKYKYALVRLGFVEAVELIRSDLRDPENRALCNALAGMFQHIRTGQAECLHCGQRLAARHGVGEFVVMYPANFIEDPEAIGSGVCPGCSGKSLLECAEQFSKMLNIKPVAITAGASEAGRA